MSLGAARAAMFGASNLGETSELMDYSAGVWGNAVSLTLSNGDLTATAITSGVYGRVLGTLAVVGSVYFEATVTPFNVEGSFIGVSSIAVPPEQSISLGAGEYGYLVTDTALFGVAYNVDTGHLLVYKAGVLVLDTVAAIGMVPWCRTGRHASTGSVVANFGASAFTYTPVEA